MSSSGSVCRSCKNKGVSVDALQAEPKDAACKLDVCSVKFGDTGRMHSFNGSKHNWLAKPGSSAATAPLAMKLARCCKQNGSNICSLFQQNMVQN